MKKFLLLSLSLLFMICAKAQVDNSIRDGGEYMFYNVYYGRVLGGNANDSSPTLSAFGTNDADDYVFVAEASSLHSGYYWLRHKKTGKYLQASNADGDTWSVWLAGSLNPSYNSYEWALTPGIEGYIKSNRGEVINSAGNAWLAPDPNHESETYVNVYYDKPQIDRAVWQILDASASIDEARLALYVDDLMQAIALGESIMENPAFGTDDEKYALAAALYNARNAGEAASIDNLDAITTATQALQAAIANAQEGNYAVWVSGSSFKTGNAFTVALNGVKFAAAQGETLPYCTMAVRNSQRTGAMLDIDAKGVKIGDLAIDFDNTESHDIHLAFDGVNVTIYIDGVNKGVAPQQAVPTVSACGQAAEWTVFGIKTLDAYRPEILCDSQALAPGEAAYNDYDKIETHAIKLVGQDIAIDGDIDYHIAADSVMTNSKIDLQGENAWLILDNVRPSDVLAYYLDAITIDGKPAVPAMLPYWDEEAEEEVFPDNAQANCRVAIYLQGAVVIPHSAEYVPFIGYSEKGYSGQEWKLELGNNTLTDMCNEMQSFILKRGYMATLANNADGSGYSRVYVADHEDKCISELPDLLNQRVSFIYVRKWNYVSKKGWCGTSSDASMGEQGKLLGATWFYSWSASRESQIDMEFIPMQCHRFWPNLSDFYPKENSTAMLLLNEPEHNEQHTSDRCSCGGTTDPWTACTMNPNYFHTGLRIGGPSPTDGGWLKEYVGHCDDMSYRCDFVGYHAYWGTYEASNADAWYNRLKGIYDNCKRPIWLTEWNNGASWTKEPWPSSWNDQLDYQRRKIIEICNMLDNAPFIERYTIFNLNEDKRKVLKWDSEIGDWWVTPAGEAYRDQHPTHAYNEAMQKVPVGWFPGLKSEVALSASINEADKTLTFTITNPNGDNSAYEAVEFANEDFDWCPLFQRQRCDLDLAEAQSYTIPADEFPDDPFFDSQLVIRLKVETHKGGQATSKRVVLNIPDSMRRHMGITSAVSDEPCRYFNLQGLEVANPEAGQVYIVVQGDRTFKAVKGN